MYDSDRGIEEMLARLGPDRDGLASDQGDEPSDASINVEWLAEQMRHFVDLNPDWEDAIGRFASQLARADEPED